MALVPRILVWRSAGLVLWAVLASKVNALFHPVLFQLEQVLGDLDQCFRELHCSAQRL